MRKIQQMGPGMYIIESLLICYPPPLSDGRSKRVHEFLCVMKIIHTTFTFDKNPIRKTKSFGTKLICVYQNSFPIYTLLWFAHFVSTWFHITECEVWRPLFWICSFALFFRKSKIKHYWVSVHFLSLLLQQPKFTSFLLSLLVVAFFDIWNKHFTAYSKLKVSTPKI